MVSTDDASPGHVDLTSKDKESVPWANEEATEAAILFSQRLDLPRNTRGLTDDVDIMITPKNKEKAPFNEFSPSTGAVLAQPLESLNITTQERPFFVTIDQDGIIPALMRLDAQLLQVGRPSLLSKKTPTNWLGKEVRPGQIGLIHHGGYPKVLLTPGRYPGFPFRNWWGRKWAGTKGLSDTVIDFNGLVVVQVSQNQAAVVSDPKNHIFVIKGSGFIACAVDGTYDVLSVVNPTDLRIPVRDPFTGVVLGRTQKVKMKSKVGELEKKYVVATFLDMPANNCFVLQHGGDLELLGAGQFVITNPTVTVRGLYTRRENQLQMPREDVILNVPDKSTIFLKWELTDPLILAMRGYETPYDALRDMSEPILVKYASNPKIKQHINDPVDGGDSSSDSLVALWSQAKDDMSQAALECGIVLKDFAVVEQRDPPSPATSPLTTPSTSRSPSRAADSSQFSAH